jgi:thiol-disulfide isomerase/thioredoxin
VKVPAAPAGRPFEPFDLGELPMAIRGKMRPGGRAPSLRTQTYDGKPVSLDDFRGRFVLLDFWAMWNSNLRRQELNTLTNLYARYAVSNKLVVISLNVDPQREPGEAFLKTNSLPWLQCYLGGSGMNEVMPSFGFEGLPANVLIDPQGRIHSRNLRGSTLLNAVRRALTQASTSAN